METVFPMVETVTVAMVPARTVAEATAMGMVTVAPTGQNGNGGNGSAIYCGAGNGNTNGNGNGRLTSKQYKYILKLNQEQGRSSADLDQQCLNMFGSVAQYLSKGDASTVIEQLMAG
jgi:hypothetical protein